MYVYNKSKYAIGNIFFATEVVCCQKIDSLYQALKTVVDNSLKATILNDLSLEYTYSDAKEAEDFALQALKIAKKYQLEEQEASAYNHFGLIYLNQNNYYQV